MEKSPGEDSFTLEFYNCFFDLVSKDLINGFQKAYSENEVSIYSIGDLVSREAVSCVGGKVQY